MNYLVGLLLTYMSEEETFWALRQLMENSPFLMSTWFNQDLTMVHTCGYQMERLLDKYLPAIGSYLRDIGITPILYTPEVVSFGLRNKTHPCSGLCVFTPDRSLLMWLSVSGIFLSLKDGPLFIKSRWLF